MNEVIQITLHPRDTVKSEYDQLYINFGEQYIGKARCKIDGKVLTIYSINIFEEFRASGYGRHFVELAKEQFAVLIADRVRNTAIGFWEEMGFEEKEEGNWMWTNKEHDPVILLA